MKTILYQNADWILTMDGDRRRYRHGDLLISGNEIVDVGERLAEKHRATTPIDEVVDASGRVILPGFVNVHHHTWQSLIRNLNVANGLVLEPWLQVMFEIFKDLTPEVARAGVYAGLGDALKTGCTTSNDLFYPHPVEGLVEATILAAEEIGIRFHPNRGFESLASNIVPPEIISAPEEIIADTERLVKRYHDPSRFSMCRVGVAPSMPQYGTLESLRAALDLAEKYDLLVHGHLAESRYETEFTLEKFGCRPFEWFRRHDLLGERFYYAHCVHINEEEVRQMAKTNTGIAHCPISNMFLNSGVSPIPAYLKAGVSRIGLGVDGAASSNSSNMMEEIRSAYLVNRLTWGRDAVGPEDILYLATAGGAKTLGRDDIGFLAPHMAADLVVMDWNQLQYAGGCNDPAACIVISGDPRMVKDVVVNGETVVRDGKLTHIDEAGMCGLVNRVGRELLTKASVREPRLKADLV